MHRGLKPLLALAGVALAAGCAAPSEPQVTFYSHGRSVTVAPAQYCDPTGKNCATSSGNMVGELRVPSREPLQISVPAEVAAAPWQVAFIYRGVNGEELDGRSSVFRPHERFAYTLHLPPDGAQFEHVEVQQFSAVLTPGADGGVDFGIGGSWILDVHQ
ncbi:hypothetical protein GCM10011581_01790 [Saccharopolyspora subtropica]|uniref:DUF2771 family protein n=1 Tax=Saccharopolyspora thermophila TaxID=89367 RepID=A0A917JHU1_9PSEU|nr:DUF2771 family protein [Saccharopolyspora subtropica]GGI68509.1 hypothetical protein GCM10011581_01790 [Saccharopolyspora subtropica]